MTHVAKSGAGSDAEDHYKGPHMRVIGTIRSTASERITVEAGRYQEARELLEAKIPEGHDLIAIRTNT